MRAVNMFEAKSSLSRLVEEVESGRTEGVVIARAGKPAARLVPMGAPVRRRLGVAKGQFVVPESIDGLDSQIAVLFGVGDAPDASCARDVAGDDDASPDGDRAPESGTAGGSR
ncbi:MAG: type II toxin-antitoxin system Phd/YefM family antitoxin [Bifidobacteriaceae bacterium]|nr:type II toxin-antitoxin system Phd/YefM family antitoxin [Bifidobacteriaceae bacterium]